MTFGRFENPDDLAGQVIEFYIGCVEDEARGDVFVQLGSADYVELEDGLSPVLGARSLPDNRAAERFRQEHEVGPGGSIVAGWPLIVGTHPRERRGGVLVASPLLMVDVRLARNGKVWSIKPAGSDVDFNHFALELLDVDRYERNYLAQLVQDSPEVREARWAEDRADAILRILCDYGIKGLAHLDPRALVPQSRSAGIHNTGLIFAPIGSTLFTSMLLEDLQEMSDNPVLLTSGPVATMLGLATTPPASFPIPHPTVLPSTLAQDQAVSSAMENVLTVVTGPPGTGKSQVLVNVVAAAVARGESVLFASKNNRAVDVVFDRLKETNYDPCIIRVGWVSMRGGVAARIAKILEVAPRIVDFQAARRRWSSIEVQVRNIHERLRALRLRDERIVELQATTARRELDDQLRELDQERTQAGLDLLNAWWQKVREDNPDARVAAEKLAEQLAAERHDNELVPATLPLIPVWGVTNLSARTNLPLDEGLFDLVVIDEASQCDVASALPLLVRGRRALIIGDPHQLTHIASLSPTREMTIGRRCGLTEDRINEFSYGNKSCFGLAASRVNESTIFLDQHFRSHPAIIGFSNKLFYNGQLEFRSVNRPQEGLTPIEWMEVDGDSEHGRGSSLINYQEAVALAEALAKNVQAYLEQDYSKRLSIGVVTPYRAQVILINDLLKNLIYELDLKVTVTIPYGPQEERVQSGSANSQFEVRIGTAHWFQGDERDVMYFSPVVGPSTTKEQAAWAADPNLVNVALTRACRRLVIFGNTEACRSSETVLADLVEYVIRTLGQKDLHNVAELRGAL